MKPLINLAIVAVLPFFFPKEQTLADAQQYCSARFEFCVDYPEGELPRQQSSPNDDGVILKAEDGLSVVSASASFNVFGWEPKELSDFSVKELSTSTRDGADATVISSVFGEDFYEAFFIHGGTSYYHRSFFFVDHYVLLTIAVPANQPRLMERLREDVSVNFHL